MREGPAAAELVEVNSGGGGGGMARLYRLLPVELVLENEDELGAGNVVSGESVPKGR